MTRSIARNLYGRPADAGTVQMVEVSAGPGPTGGRDWLARWFESDRMARVIVSRTGQILAMNPAAEAIVRRGGCLVERNGLLTTTARQTATLLEAMINGEGGDDTPLALCPLSERAVLVRAQRLDDEVVALTLRDLSRDYELVVPDLGDIFGLTPAETAVVGQLIRGRGSAEIARALEKSVLTVRTHVKRIYAKLHVKSREQLFARMLPYVSLR